MVAALVENHPDPIPKLLGDDGLDFAGDQLGSRIAPAFPPVFTLDPRLPVEDLDAAVDRVGAIVTDGELLRGVRFFGGRARTHSLLMSYRYGLVRFIGQRPSGTTATRRG